MTMNDDELKRKLAAVELSAPGTGVAEVMRAARVRPGRGPLARLALATALVWIGVWVVQVATVRSLAGLTPAPTMTAETTPGGSGTAALGVGLARQQALLSDLLPEGPAAEAGPIGRPNAPAAPERHPGRRGETEGLREHCERRWTYA